MPQNCATGSSSGGPITSSSSWRVNFSYNQAGLAPMDSLETSILDFVADASGARRNKLSLTTQLSEDLGIEGLDAEELFQTFGEKFGVDLTPLWDYWDYHFAPEGGPGWPFLIPCLICLLIGAAIHQAVAWLPFWVYGIALLVLWIWPLRCWPFTGKQAIPITVQELVEAARQGRWVKSYEAIS
jgi:hypothetical protein